MTKLIEFKFQESQDIAEHRHYSQQVLKDAIDIYEATLGYPPRPWRWPSAAEFRAMAAQEPDPMIALNAHRKRLNPDPFRFLRLRRRLPRAK